MKLYLIFAKSPSDPPDRGFRFGGSVREADVDDLEGQLPADVQTWRINVDTEDAGIDLPADLEAVLNAYLVARDGPLSHEQGPDVWPEDHPLHALSEEHTEP